MLELLADPNAWAALVTLTALEIVLGIDNIVFISILVSRLPPREAETARKVGILLAFVFRIMLLLAITWIMGLVAPVVTVFGNELSWRDLILLVGGLFLIGKATHEIHAEVEANDHADDPKQKAASGAFWFIIMQLVAIDMVFSLDSILTAIGMVEDIEVMIAAVVIAMVVMYVSSGPVAGFIARHPTTKMLALAFLVMIGGALVADAFEVHIPRGYIYSSMAFAAAVEAFNVWAQSNRRRKSVRKRYSETSTPEQTP